MLKNKYKSDAFESIHEIASGLHKSGIIQDESMEYFNKSCLVSKKVEKRNFDYSKLLKVTLLSADEIRDIRLKSKVSQAVFAKILNVSKTLISQWERNERKPSGPSLKLLNLVKSKGIEEIL